MHTTKQIFVLFIVHLMLSVSFGALASEVVLMSEVSQIPET